MGDLPEDLLLDILAKVPEASLARFRLASKGWKALIEKDGRLAKKSLVIMLIKSRIYVARFDPHGSHENVIKGKSKISVKHPFSKQVSIRNVFHCDGLLLCTTAKENILAVLNPCTGETSRVKTRISHEKIGMYALGKSSRNKYKILRINKFSIMDKPLVDYEIYDLDTNSWRVTVGENREWYITGLGPLCGMSVDGNTYWLADGNGGQCILSFDFSTERFGRVSLPPGHKHFSYDVTGLSVTIEEQQLCLLTTQSIVVLYLWRATKIESSGAVSWTMILSVDLVHHPLKLLTGMNFLADRENRVLVCPGKSNRFFLHILGEDMHIKVDGDYAGSECSLLVSYVPTLAQIQ